MTQANGKVQLTQATFDAARKAWAAALTPAVQEAYNAYITARAALKNGTADQKAVDAAKKKLDTVYGTAERKVYATYVEARVTAKELGLTLTPLRAP